MSSSVRLAVIGAGLVGKRHIEHIIAEPRTELHAVVDPSPAGKEVASARGARWYPDFTAMIAEGRPDNSDGEDLFGWACEADCAANGNGADIAKGLGQLELKPEEMRGLICASRSFLEDVAIDIEGWIARKAQQGVRRIASRAIAVGSGVGMPMGILNPQSGIPICDTGTGTPAGQITWQDLVGLMFEVPMEYHAGASWLMNQRTLGQLFGISDANGRPILLQDLQNPLRWMLLGHPVVVSQFWPDVAPGATPVAFGDWKAAYLLVNRKALTLLPDIYSAGWCVLYRLYARLGGGVICPQAARLMRIK